MGTASKVAPTSSAYENGEVSQDLDGLRRSEEIEEKRAEQEIKERRAQMRILDNSDQMTQFLKGAFGVSYLVPDLDYRDDRYPRDENGLRISVTRFYPAIDLVIHKIPKGWTDEMIQAFKWAVEKCGQSYFWMKPNEVLEFDKDDKESVFHQRLKKLDKEPTYKFPVFKREIRVSGF